MEDETIGICYDPLGTMLLCSLHLHQRLLALEAAQQLRNLVSRQASLGGGLHETKGLVCYSCTSYATVLTSMAFCVCAMWAMLVMFTKASAGMVICMES